MPRNRPYVELHSMVSVSLEYRYIYRPEGAESFARLALELLVAELGTEGARLFLREEFATYLRDYRGFGRDKRKPKIADQEVNGGFCSTAHQPYPGRT